MSGFCNLNFFQEKSCCDAGARSRLGPGLDIGGNGRKRATGLVIFISLRIGELSSYPPRSLT